MTENNNIICGDVADVLKTLPEHSIDLIFGSPPYEDARSYGLPDGPTGQDWVDWMVEIYSASLRVARGLVAFVIAGRTKNYEWSCTPALLIADLHRKGICVREGPYYHRVGIPGSDGPDWLRHDLEFIVSCTNGGKLPWSDNCAMGEPPKYKKPGGPCSNWHVQATSGYVKGDTRTVSKKYEPPERSNPGIVIECGVAGGGHLGSKLAHENEAPFPEKLAECMIRSFCPPGGVVLDPFSGSGTTVCVAKRWGRNYIGIDIRQSQVDLTNRRLNDETGLFDGSLSPQR